MALELPKLKRILSDCCTEHHEMCWYDACCGKCPELERCRARLTLTNEVCVKKVSEHENHRGNRLEDHEWALVPAKTWEGDNG